jgi:uncharacterized protein (TIGR03118 family)
MLFFTRLKGSILLFPIILVALVVGGVFGAPAIHAAGNSHSGGFYRQTNLVSDLAGIARVQDTNLVNSWGLSHSPKGPWWISDNGTGLATVYKGDGTPFNPLVPSGTPPLVVTIPPPTGSPGTTAAPTGNVFNPTSDFAVPVPQGPGSKPSIFIFATEDGTISGWNPGIAQTQAILAVDNSGVTQGVFTGAVYKGLALAQTSSGNFLYATNFRFGTVEQYDANFHLVRSFTDPDLNKQCDLTVLTNVCFAPFGIQNIGGNLFVTFALQKAGTPGQPGTFKHDDQAGPGNGFVDVFDTNGNLIRRFASGGTLNSPWGLTLAPNGFGRFGKDLLVGNFGDGHINAFDPATGAFRGQLQGQGGSSNPITINGLWGLGFGNGGLAGPTDTLFFTAGINDEADGLFGSITKGQG